MRIIYFAVLIFSFNYAHADNCQSEFQSHHIIITNPAPGAGAKIYDQEEYEQAKWLVDFIGRCPSFFPTYVNKVNADKPRIEANIKDWEQRSACPDHLYCEDRVVKNAWFKSSPEELRDPKTIDKMVQSRIMNMNFTERDKDDFFKDLKADAQKCECVLNKKGYQEKVALIGEAIKNWEQDKIANHKKAAEKVAKDKAFLAEKAQKIAAKSTARKAESERLQRLAATKECKAAKAKAEYCESMAAIRSYERVIEHENKVGQQSGYVNKATLHQATSLKINVEEKAQSQQAAYQNISGQKIDRQSCHLVNGEGNVVRAGPDVGAEFKRFCGYDPL